MPACLGGVLGADAAGPVAGGQAEAGSAASRRVRGARPAESFHGSRWH